MLEKIPEASEADASEAAPESASKETQTSDLPSIIPTQTSPSNDSNLDDIPIGQRMKQLQKPSPKPQQTIPQLPLQEEQTSAAAEGSEDPEEPIISNLPTCDSPLNLHSLEKHLGGELQETPEKATKAVPEKTDLVNQQQQQPEPPQQTDPEQTSTSTQITTQTQTTSSPQKTIPEPVVETMVPESVQVTESEPSVTITVSEPSQNPTNSQTTNQTAIHDQPSSSSTIQTNKPTIQVLESELMAISAELQRLVQLRRSSSLTDDYQERWATLKDRTSELVNILSLKCIKIHEDANLHRISSVHLIEEDPAPLFLAYTPFYHKSEYMTREGREVKLLREKAQKEQEAAKAREDLLLQKQLELEAELKRKEALIQQLMNKQPNP